MGSYIPNNRKKKDRLERLSEAIRRLIAHGASQESLLKVALEIRDGRIRVVRARQHARHPFDVDGAQKDSSEIESLKRLTPEAVLAEYLPAE